MAVICALYKTFSGEEFVSESIKSIQSHVDHIVMVHSEVNWVGKRGNTVYPIVEEDKSIHHIVGEWDNQDEQYKVGFEYIKDQIKCDYVLIIDTDEVWDDENWRKLKSFLKIDGCRANAFSCRMKTFIKKRTYMIDPPEPCSPVILVKPNSAFKGVRGNRTVGIQHLNDVWFKHYSYVRKDYETVLEKIKTSHTGDGLAHIDLEKWKEEKWDKLPEATDFHTTAGFERNWKRIVEVEDV